ncbi:DUF7677 family protein [Clostridium felsineum]|uniref:DUF7677 family protein n=1 Tax=Clostridium felsineum TaxID=36839 RepID=UPI00098CE275|nr:hypothetical protein [Clostridium felsineum]URZ04289.1 hypothetical protein CLAUR_043780 [Clostridium felsineum]
MKKLSNSFSGVLRTFSFWIVNGTVGYPLLDGIDYSCIFDEPSMMEQAYAIFANVIEMDDDGNVLNAKYAEKKATQFIRSYVDDDYIIEPPLKEWEVKLY